METNQKKSFNFIFGFGLMVFGTIIVLSKIIKYFVFIGVSFFVMMLTNGGASKNSNGNRFFVISKTLTITSFATLCLMIALFMNSKPMDRVRLRTMIANLIQTDQDKAELENIHKDELIYNKLMREKKENEKIHEDATLLNDSKKKEFLISSAFVKKNGEKYRFYFDIKNISKKQFNSHIKIALHSVNGNTYPVEIFKEGSCHPPQKLVFVEINSGPIQTHGEFGINRFDYEIIRNKQVIEKGEGDITNNVASL